MRRHTIAAFAGVMIAAGLAFTGCGAASINTVKQNEDKVIAVVKAGTEGTKAGSETANVSDEKGRTEYLNGTYSISYDPEYFSTYEDAKEDTVTIPFYKDGFKMAGSNFIAISEIKDTDCKTVIEDLMDKEGGSEKNICTNYIAGEDNPGLTYAPDTKSSEESGLKIMSVYYAVPDGENVVLIEEFRTVGPDTATETFIDDQMIDVLSSFELMGK